MNRNKNPITYCCCCNRLFFLKRTGATIVIREKLAIFADFKVTRLTGYSEDVSSNASVPIGGSEDVTLRYANGIDTVEFEITRGDDMEQMLIELKRLINIAQDRGLASSGSSHRWIHYYSIHSELSTINTIEGPPSPVNVDDDGHKRESGGIASTDLRAVKEEWVSKQLLDREEEFTERSPIRVFTGTWNVNGRYTDESLDSWLRMTEQFDIYAIGFKNWILVQKLI
ncbi:hypothetical protein BDF19DRAFT_28950 [Syncephalis fuscata]|nr:hypothetical protein BDF19DRAFT_28950 [Syncephalis fuscata]